MGCRVITSKSFSVIVLWFHFLSGSAYRDKIVFRTEQLNNGLAGCGFDESVGVISDGDATDQALLVSLGHSMTLATYFHIRDRTDQEIQSWIRRTYTDARVTDFVVAVNNPGSVLENADAVFRNESYGKLSGLPHMTRWLVLTWRKRQLRQIKDQQVRSSMDNVAMVYVVVENPPQYTIVKQIWTFFWNKNRTRTSHRVNKNAFGKSCTIFPNSKYFMNERQLQIIAKSDSHRLLSHRLNPDTGEYEYAGFIIQLIGALSQMMNFTYVTWPPPDQMRAMDWDVFDRLVSNGTFAFGAAHYDSFWASLHAVLEVSSPHTYDTVTGIYKKPRDVCFILFSYKCGKKKVYLFLIFIYTISLGTFVTFYFIVVHILYQSSRTRDDSDSNVEVFSRKSMGRPSNFTEDTRTKGCVHKYMNDLTYFLSTAVNQGSLPTVRGMPGKTLVCTWGAFTMCFNAWFTSSITADTVKKVDRLPFRTFPEMIESHDYSWGILNSLDTVNYTLANSRRDVMIQLNKHAQRLPHDQTRPLEESIAVVLDSLPENFVFIYFKSPIEHWLRQQANPNDYALIESDLFDSSHGFTFPKGSQINMMVSRKILRLHDTGVMQEMFAEPRLRNESSLEWDDPISLDGPIFATICFLSLLLITISTLMLVAELITHKIRRKSIDESNRDI